MSDYEIILGERTLFLTEDEFDALWTLTPPYCNRPDPLKGAWHKEQPGTRSARERLFAEGLIDAYGNVEAIGMEIVSTIFAEDEHLAAMLTIEAEFEELDRLDEACRRRPHVRRYDG